MSQQAGEVKVKVDKQNEFPGSSPYFGTVIGWVGIPGSTNERGHVIAIVRDQSGGFHEEYAHRLYQVEPSES